MAAVTKRVFLGLNYATLLMTAGMALMKLTAKITRVVISTTQTSAAGFRLKTTKWTGHGTKAIHHPSTQVT